ncbi:MAG: hypothetical protein M1814_001209 [Vezdaea aestivalis]|nr:MAG: hypothetical protein M1814_001209 [Vezdaea aestivalis]
MESSQVSAQAREVLQPHLDRLLESRVSPKTICPSEVPRALSAAELAQAGVSSWRDLMDEARALAEEKRLAGLVEVVQRGVTVDDSIPMAEIKGPIRLRNRASES